MNAMYELMDWLMRNRPDLERELRYKDNWTRAQILMKETGVTVLPSDCKDPGCRAFLAALIAKSKEVPEGATDNR